MYTPDRAPQRCTAFVISYAMLLSFMVPRTTMGAAGWQYLAPLPAARSGLAAVTGADGRIYVVGGADTNGIPLATMEAYDPNTNAWARLSPMPTARTALAAVLGPDGRIYAIGGSLSWDGPGLTTVEAYQPQTNTWSAVAPLPTGRGELAAAVGGDGRIYVMGGIGPGGVHSPGSFVEKTHAYSPVSNTWTRVASMPAARTQFAATAGPDGTIYVLGGWLHPQEHGTGANEAYTPSTNAWTTRTPMPIGRYTLAATTGHDGLIYVTGGQWYEPPVTDLVVYNPASDRWMAGPPLQQARAAHASVTGVDGRIYVIGGSYLFTTLDSVEVYTQPPCETELDCDDIDPCTSDACVPGGVCVHTPDAPCWNLAGTNILRVSVSGSVRGHNVRCWLRCRAATGANLFLYPDGRYAIPAPGSGLACAFPDDEHGIARPGRHDRLQLEPDDIDDIEAAFAACLATEVRLRRYDTWIRLAEDGDHLMGKTRVRAGFRAPAGYGVKLPVSVRMKMAFAGSKAGTPVERPPLKPTEARLRECPPSLDVKCVVD